MKILIADDERLSRLLLTNTLTHQGHEVRAVENGRQAWEAFQKEPFPIVISDWMMPELDGLELCRLVRAENRTHYTYVIMLTVLDGKGCYLEGMRAGADDFLTKPFDPEQLAARLHVAERILGLQREVRQLEGLLPICSYCKKIRDERNRWLSVEQYLSSRTDASFSHGICGDCYTAQVEPDLARMKARLAAPAAG